MNQAQKSLEIEAEEMQDNSVEEAILNAKVRGVTIQVILPSNDSGNTAGITTLKNGGISVYQDAHYYMHAKLIIADGTEAFAGSENISTNSLNNNWSSPSFEGDHSGTGQLFRASPLSKESGNDEGEACYL